LYIISFYFIKSYILKILSSSTYITVRIFCKFLLSIEKKFINNKNKNPQNIYNDNADFVGSSNITFIIELTPCGKEYM